MGGDLQLQNAHGLYALQPLKSTKTAALTTFQLIAATQYDSIT